MTRTAIVGSLAVLLPVGATLALQTRGAPGAPDPAVAEERAEDIAAFQERFLAVDRSYDTEEQRLAATRLVDLRRAAPSMTPAQFELAVAEIVALAGNGHTNVPTGQWRRYNRIAAQFIIFDDGMRVAWSEDDPALVGSLVESIAGKTLDELRAVWARYQPGSAGWRDQHMYDFIESPELLHAAGVGPSPDAAEVVFRRADGTRSTRSFSGVTADGSRLRGNPRELELTPVASDSRPLYLQEPDANLRYVDMPDRDAVYIQFRRNFDPLDRSAMRHAADELATRLKARRPRYVIVDQRFNTGGDLNNTRDLMKAIPSVVKEGGRVFAITSGRTFSAGISSVGYLKQAGGPKVTIVGKPVGDELDFWAEGGLLTLPRSGIRIRFSTERHNYQNGCPGPECHGSIRRNPIAVPTLAPDISPAFTWADFAAGRDPYLSAILDLMRD